GVTIAPGDGVAVRGQGEGDLVEGETADVAEDDDLPEPARESVEGVAEVVGGGGCGRDGLGGGGLAPGLLTPGGAEMVEGLASGGCDQEGRDVVQRGEAGPWEFEEAAHDGLDDVLRRAGLAEDGAGMG